MSKIWFGWHSHTKGAATHSPKIFEIEENLKKAFIDSLQVFQKYGSGIRADQSGASS